MVLKHIFSDINVLDFAEKKMRLCECGQLVLRDWDLSRINLAMRANTSFRAGNGAT